MPSKALLRPGDVIAAARRVPGAATAVTGDIDVAGVFARRDSFTGNWDDSGQVPWLLERGIELIRGHGRIDAERVVEVRGSDGVTRRVEATTAVVVATGTKPAIPPVPGLAEANPWDNRTITATSTVPHRLLVVGGGAIGCEMAQAFRRLGSAEVTVLEGFDRLIGREEPFAGDELKTAFEAEGIAVFTGVTLARVARTAEGGVVAELSDGRTVSADEILVAAGRAPATGDIGLDRVGLDPGRFIEVDDQLRAVGVPAGWLFSVGDTNGRSLLTHMGKYQARICADVILGKDVSDRADLGQVPRVVFTDPQICAVGLTEAQAIAAGRHVRTVSYPTGHVAGSAVLGEGAVGTSQIVVDQATQVIVGATFTGANVQELLHSATIAIVGEVPMERLWHAVPSFPTVSEVWLRLMEAYGL
jgi:dihydrolipoamide dehydrogenase